MEDSDRVCKKAGVPTLDLEKPVDNPDKVVSVFYICVGIAL